MGQECITALFEYLTIMQARPHYELPPLQGEAIHQVVDYDLGILVGMGRYVGILYRA